MKKILNWQSHEVVDIIDEVTLWSAPFGRLLLENIPMKKGISILDIGFGTGFPLIELSQRFGDTSRIYGVDIWTEAVKLAHKKIEVLEIANIQILEESATKISIEDDSIDLITSNLGVNNFDEKDKVYSEIRRILKPDGKLCITTNPIGTFDELFTLFDKTLEEMGLENGRRELKNYIDHRKNREIISEEFKHYGLELTKSKADTTNMRFVDATALLNHSLIRIGFREYWEKLPDQELNADFFNKLIAKIDKIIEVTGEFNLTIPMLYLEFTHI